MSVDYNPYLKELINNLYFSGSLSSAELCDRLGKSLTLTSKLLNALLVKGFVEEKGYAPSSGGRRPLVYSLKADIKYTLSVAIDQFFTTIAVMDMHNSIIGKAKTWDINLAAKKNSLKEVVEKIKETINSAGIDKDKILGIGMSMPGFVDAKKSINYSFLPVSGDFSGIGAFVEKECGVPAYIDNDSSLIALAELKFGAATHQKNTMVVNVG